jgi:hypothetical protein
MSTKLQDRCQWVKPGWALQPDDFYFEGGEAVTAQSLGLSWKINIEPETWQRPANDEPDLQHLMKKLKTIAHKLPDEVRQQFIWRMKGQIREAATALVQLCDEAQAKVSEMAPKEGE